MLGRELGGQLTLEKHDIFRQDFRRHDKEETLWELQAAFMTRQFCWFGVKGQGLVSPKPR